MTELAYLSDIPAGYVRTFRARVTGLPPGAVVLDRTYFYPGGGGQPPDRGTLRRDGASWEVADVGRAGTAVLHRLRRGRATEAPLAVGAEVEGEVDWARRYRHMRLHTGQHLLSALVFAQTGLRTSKAVLSGSGATLDLEGPLPPGGEAELDRRFTDSVARARPVSIRHIARAEWDAGAVAPRSGLVPLAPHVDPVRVVEIEAEDACPCGGTHLRSTGEVGGVRLGVDSPPAGFPRSRLTLSLAEPDRPAPPA